MTHRGMIHTGHVVAHRGVLYRLRSFLPSHRIASLHRMAHLHMRAVISYRVWSGLGCALRRIGASGWQFILHTIVLGAHRNWLDIHSVLEPLQPSSLGRLPMTGVLMRTICQFTRTASVSDNVLDLFRGDHTRVVANMDHVVRPVQVNTRDVR
jgi:hypothetical protein